MKLIICLGNPGDKYRATRHNAGFMAADQIAEVFGFEAFKESGKFRAQIAEGQIAGEKALLVKPNTYMNLSGEAANALASFYKVTPEDIVAIYDDADIERGALRIRVGGSAGGHNGVQSLINQLGTENFARFRIGIKADPPFPGPLEDYVLGRFQEGELAALEKVLPVIPKALELLFKEGAEKAMNLYN